MMKNLALILITSIIFIASACNKNDKSQRFKYLTTPTWTSDTLYANGVDASGPGQILEIFKGDCKFNEDGTGNFVDYTGTWIFNTDETKITIFTQSLSFPITCNIVELTATSFKVTTSVPNPLNLSEQLAIRMTFKAK
jgi:hypothetical protein